MPKTKQRKSVRGEIIHAVLTRLGETVCTLAELTDAYLIAGYGASPSKIRYIQETGRRARAQARDEEITRTRSAKFIYKLKRDGLIQEQQQKEGNVLYQLTRKGREKLHALMIRKPQRYRPLPSDSYVIVIFDIPEPERRKRVWLRWMLRDMGFSLVQKSVWMGKVKIPREFVNDLTTLRLNEYVQIFEARRLGTLSS